MRSRRSSVGSAVSWASDVVSPPQSRERLHKRARGLSDAILQAAPSLGLEVISPIADAERSGIVSLKLPDGVDAAATAKALLDEHRLLVSSRAGMLRVSPHIDNSNEDVERLLAVLESLFR